MQNLFKEYSGTGKNKEYSCTETLSKWRNNIYLFRWDKVVSSI